MSFKNKTTPSPSFSKGIYQSKVKPTWCPGCGNHGIYVGLKMALSELEIDPDTLFIVFGIGCSGNSADFYNCYGLHELHGRTLPAATAAKLANHELTVIAIAGDGDQYGIGLSHFIHACRRNIDITLITHNNQIYGLTTGQTSPTANKGTKSISTPNGAIEMPINPMALALTSNASFVSRGFSGNIMHLKNLIKRGIQHKGFSVVDVFQPCKTFNKINTFQYFQDRVYDLADENHDTSDKIEALKKSFEEPERLPIGIFYQEKKSTYSDELPQIAKTPLVKQDIENIHLTEAMKNVY